MNVLNPKAEFSLNIHTKVRLLLPKKQMKTHSWTNLQTTPLIDWKWPSALCAFVCSMFKSRSVACVVQQRSWAVQVLVGSSGAKVSPQQHLDFPLSDDCFLSSWPLPLPPIRPCPCQKPWMISKSLVKEAVGKVLHNKKKHANQQEIEMKKKSNWKIYAEGNMSPNKMV